MSAEREFKILMSDLFRMEEELEIVAKWTLPMAEMNRVVNEGKLPVASITMPVDHACELSLWESIYLASLRFGRDVAMMVKPRENQAAYDVYLVRSKA